jgi:multidrug efflux pump subunit AcrA (membrane-fusion protein)
MRIPGKYALPLVAAGFLIFEVVNVVLARRVPPPAEPVISPPLAPKNLRVIAGAGLIETRRENIPLGTLVSGVVTKVFVKRGDFVKQGDPLFQLDDRDLQAQLGVAVANLAASEAQLQRLLVAPQQGDIPTSEAAVEEARAHYRVAELEYQRSEALFQRQAEAATDRDRDRYAYLANKATLTRMEADLKRLKATWEKDKDVARAAVEQTRSQVDGLNIEIARLTVRAPIDGEALQVHVRPGQFAAMNWNEPMIILGDIHELHVRVDIDEQDLPYFARSSKAVATLKGSPQVQFPLTYFDTEPYVIPKQSLTGSNTERVDTRVLQVLYTLPGHPVLPLYVGQQMDVYIEAAQPPEGVALDADPRTIRKPFDGRPPPIGSGEGKRGIDR